MSGTKSFAEAMRDLGSLRSLRGLGPCKMISVGERSVLKVKVSRKRNWIQQK